MVYISSSRTDIGVAAARDTNSVVAGRLAVGPFRHRAPAFFRRASSFVMLLMNLAMVSK